MWLLFACGSAFFAGITAILAKVGIRNTDSNVATALRTSVVVVFSWVMVFLTGAQRGVTAIAPVTLLFLVLSGLATGASWVCYFRALQLGDINKVVPIDKSSIVLTVILAFILLGEPISWLNGAALVMIGVGTLMMIEKKKSAGARAKDGRWLIYALLSALFASLTSILGKIGITGIDSNLGTAIRTVVVLIMAWMIVFAQGKQGEIRGIDRRSWLFLALSGVATGLSWLCYYRALQQGPASAVVPIDKLSILVTVAFAWVFMGEKLSKKSAAGLVLIVAGTLLMTV
ncbi:MAG: EamA family transporter [Clostridia bacterium]|nr:EamA family transporter [Clostridia bacterium]